MPDHDLEITTNIENNRKGLTKGEGNWKMEEKLPSISKFPQCKGTLITDKTNNKGNGLA